MIAIPFSFLTNNRNIIFLFDSVIVVTFQNIFRAEMH